MKNRHNQQPLISVVIPVYNTGCYLSECFDSVLNQTYSNLEIIAVDDHSTDSSPQICDEYAQKDKRIKIIHQQNGGPSRARNAGIQKSNGEYITFIDSDDWIEKNYIETLYSDLIEHQVEISVVKHFINYQEKETIVASGKRGILNQEECLKKLLYEDDMYTSACAKLYKKELFANISFPEGRLYEDLATVYKLILQTDYIYLNSIPLYHYRKTNTKSITNSEFNESKLDLLWASAQFVQDVTNKYPELTQAGLARTMDAYVRTLTETIKGTPSKKLIRELMTYIKTNRKSVLCDKNLATKNRLMLAATLFGYQPFCLFRKFYETTTKQYNTQFHNKHKTMEITK